MRPVYIAGTGLWPDAGPSAAAEAVAGAAEPRPPCELVPSRAKRGTSLLTQMMVEVATRTARAAGFDLGTAATVFGSSHGEMEIAVDQMVMMKDGKGLLSPARFKNSVHNTGAGLFTIGAGNQGFTTAIAAGQDTAAMALLEGWLLLDRGEADEVIVTVADEALPEPLRAFAPHAPLAVGVALCTAPPSPDAPRIARLRCDPAAGVVRDARFAGNPAAGLLALVDAVEACGSAAPGALRQEPRTVPLSLDGGEPWCVDLYIDGAGAAQADPPAVPAEP
ncbi:MAG: beta-ketoacyl synthase chain length factor [Myxococcales bacterium]|nr:beta-ketoacyl synthase chain length factor [Myxococcales bacterium]